MCQLHGMKVKLRFYLVYTICPNDRTICMLILKQTKALINIEQNMNHRSSLAPNRSIIMAKWPIKCELNFLMNTSRVHGFHKFNFDIHNDPYFLLFLFVCALICDDLGVLPFSITFALCSLFTNKTRQFEKCWDCPAPEQLTVIIIIIMSSVDFAANQKGRHFGWSQSKYKIIS